MTEEAMKKVCDEVLEIMQMYREQEKSAYGVGTPGGLEDMGDVWSKLMKWEKILKFETND